MDEIGKSLQRARERLGVTLAEVEDATRIRTHHIEALERGDHDALPSPVQARGFLRNYADFLGLDTDAILLQYAEALQARRKRKIKVSAAPESSVSSVKRRRPSWLRWLSFDLFFAAFISLLVIALLIWGASRVIASLQDRPDATEVALGFLIPTQTATLRSTESLNETARPAAPLVPVSETPEATPALQFPEAEVVDIRVLAEKRSWVQVRVDGEEVFSGRMGPGEELSFQGEAVVEILTGNGDGIRIFYRGQDQGLLGGVGQVVLRLWTLEGVITATPTVTRTPEPRTETPTLATPAPGTGE
jgi:cytoskeletal protein RodZ